MGLVHRFSMRNPDTDEVLAPNRGIAVAKPCCRSFFFSRTHLLFFFCQMPAAKRVRKQTEVYNPETDGANDSTRLGKVRKTIKKKSAPKKVRRFVTVCDHVFAVS